MGLKMKIVKQGTPFKYPEKPGDPYYIAPETLFEADCSGCKARISFALKEGRYAWNPICHHPMLSIDCPTPSCGNTLFPHLEFKDGVLQLPERRIRIEENLAGPDDQLELENESEPDHDEALDTDPTALDPPEEPPFQGGIVIQQGTRSQESLEWGAKPLWWKLIHMWSRKNG